MGLVFYNPNPHGRRVGDCTVRAISKALGQSREDGQERMMEHLHQAMESATTDRERESIRRMLDELRRG